MAVFTPRPLQIPNMRTDYSAENSAFSNLGQTLGSMPSEFRKEQLNAQKQQILGQIGTGNMDYEKAGRSLIALGDTQAGATLLGLGQKQQERDLEKAWMNGGAGLGAAPSQPLGAAPAASAKMPPSEIKAIIDANVPEADREYAYRMAQKESSFNPGAVSPTGAKGLFQFTGGTGRQYGLVDRAGDIRDNPTANTQAFARFTEDNRQALRQALGRDPTYGELALAHQQGAGGAIALITGKGDVNPNNLRVNNADPNAPRSESARRIMAYYGYGDTQPSAAPTGQPAQVAQANAIPGENAAKLRADAQYYAQTNPEAARQMNARADALEQSRGSQVAQAAPQPGQPVADVPASGAKEAQFVLPGTGEVIPQAISTDPAVRAAMGRYVTAPTERTRAVAKQALDLAVKDAERRQAVNQPTDETKNFEQFRREEIAAGRPAPTRAEYLSLKRSQNSVTVDQRGETEEAKAIGQAAGKRAGEMMAAAASGTKQLQRIGQLESLLKNVESGRLQPGRMSMAALGKSLGVNEDFLRGIGLDPSKVGDAQAVNAITGRMVVDMIGSGGFPANNFSDADRAFITGTVASLANDPRGNEIILEAGRRTAQIDIDKAKAWREWRKDNKGGSFDDFEVQWGEKLASQDRFADLAKKAEAILGPKASAGTDWQDLGGGIKIRKKQ